MHSPVSVAKTREQNFFSSESEQICVDGRILGFFKHVLCEGRYFLSHLPLIKWYSDLKLCAYSEICLTIIEEVKTLIIAVIHNLSSCESKA